MIEFSNDIRSLTEALEKAERINRRQSDFLNRMSHEIRTPLNAIIGLSYLSKESETMPPKVYENLGRIEQSAHFLLSFVNDILSLSEIESGKIALKYDSVENAVYFKELMQKMKKMADAKQIHFSYTLPCEMDRYYVFDGDKLTTAIFYLIENAVKSTAAGGTIQFDAEVLSQDREYAVLQFRISDNGLGIEEEKLPGVFEPFEQIYGESRTLYSGSGLELAITKSIVGLMNGSITVQSKRGEGTNFTITVQVRIERRKNRRPKKDTGGENQYDFTGKRALVVEDSHINIEIAKNILLHKNFEVEVAVNGEEAVEAFKKREAGYFDVILMDIRMPVMDGLEATEKIRKDVDRPDGEHIPIIAMTANAFEEDVKKSLEAGMNDHLSKPIDIKKMYALLDAVLEAEE